MENFIFCAVIGFDNYEACIKQNNCICFFFINWAIEET